VTAAVPARFRARARQDAAAFYLSQIAQGIRSGELTLETQGQPTTVATSEFLFLEIQVKQKKRGNSIGIKLRWPARPLIRVAKGEGGHHG
jgi:amphi-Trp domain-containing protein